MHPKKSSQHSAGAFEARPPTGSLSLAWSVTDSSANNAVSRDHTLERALSLSLAVKHKQRDPIKRFQASLTGAAAQAMVSIRAPKYTALYTHEASLSTTRTRTQQTSYLLFCYTKVCDTTHIVDE